MRWPDPLLSLWPSPSLSPSRRRRRALVLTSWSPPPLFFFVNSNSRRPYVCEADIAVRIDANATAVRGTSRNYGKLVSYSSPSVPQGRTVCASQFTANSGNVACKQLGYDSGRATLLSQQEQSGGVAVRTVVGKNCGGLG
jgi:hypothetical protein